MRTKFDAMGWNMHKRICAMCALTLCLLLLASGGRSLAPLDYSVKAEPKTLVVERHTSAGEPPKYSLVFTFEVKNVSQVPWKGQTNSAQVTEFEVFRAEGSEQKPVWRWSEGRMFAQVITSVSIDAGKARKTSETWEFTADKVADGSYSVRATFLPTGGKASATFKIKSKH
jgi:hypothetical protein